ncbi:hypothetical protein OC835_007507 [Tilletia horrida]|uniref:RRM domain-containing protein n=1 Tax=Tilletia horrida TaxID=155126 RepID=A0AAN6GAD0_9BASI|nr:hypothetical protein OC835_007507 [Tilletia horrida]KAK0530152.1 hypothetical protein OC842_004012 [Tilletia horrida]
MTSIIVTNIASSTTKQGLSDYLSYCGAISSIDLSSDGSHQKATVHFEKASAATTASMLSGGSLDGNTLEIKLAQSGTDTAKTAANQTADAAKSTANQAADSAKATADQAAGAAKDTANAAKDKAQQLKDDVIGQEDKPRSTIIAEYLASGYIISDDVTKRAIDFDKQHGYSEKFTHFLQSLDRSLGEKLTKAPAAAPTQATKEAAESSPATTTGGSATSTDPSLARQVQAQATAIANHPAVKTRTEWAWSKLSEYYNAIINHPRIHEYYSATTRTVQDVHEEAKRIKAEKEKAKASA